VTRIAHFCCGSLRGEATGEPVFVAACHCMECQRRTGSPFGAFADPSMPWPNFSVWETAQHPWVTFDHELDHFVHQPELIEDPVMADVPH
jgi:hypothetical protein